MAWADEFLLSLVIGNAAALMGADRRIGEDTALGAKENCRNTLLCCGEGVGGADLEL